MSAFLSDLDVRLMEDTQDGAWKILAPFTYQSDLLGKTITVRPGFTTDFCSVPHIPGLYEVLGDQFRRAGTVHDWLYSTHEVNRETADRVLREMLLVEGAGEVVAEDFYLAVRVGGGSHW